MLNGFKWLRMGSSSSLLYDNVPLGFLSACSMDYVAYSFVLTDFPVKTKNVITGLLFVRLFDFTWISFMCIS
jgi:hypothetical protein